MMYRAKFKSGLLLLLIAVSIVLLFTVGCTSGTTKTQENGFAVSGSSRLVVNSQNGNVEVIAGAGNEVVVKALLKNADKVEYELKQVGDTITVDVKVDKTWWLFSDGGADITITAPAKTDVAIETSNGYVELHGLEGSGSVKTSNGLIVLDSLKGEFDASTSNGRIECGSMQGSLKLRTSNGKVEVSNMEGTVDAETSNGSVLFSGNMTAGGDNRLITSNGSVYVEFQGISSLVLDVETSNGEVYCDLSLVDTVNKKGRLVGTIGAGESDLYIRTSNGDVGIK